MSHTTKRSRMPLGIFSTARTKSSGKIVSLAARRLFNRLMFRGSHSLGAVFQAAPRVSEPAKSTNTAYHLIDILFALMMNATDAGVIYGHLSHLHFIAPFAA